MPCVSRKSGSEGTGVCDVDEVARCSGCKARGRKQARRVDGAARQIHGYAASGFDSAPCTTLLPLRDHAWHIVTTGTMAVAIGRAFSESFTANFREKSTALWLHNECQGCALRGRSHVCDYSRCAMDAAIAGKVFSSK